VPLPTILLNLRKRLGRVRRRFALDIFDVFVRAVPGEIRFEPPPGYEFRFGTARDVESCAERHTELDARERREGVQRLALGHRVVLGIHAGTVVFTMWVNPRCLNVPGLLKRALGPRQWFIYKAFTSPEHRGRRLYEGGMRFVLAEMRRAGLEELVGYAHVKKTVSRRGLAALEFVTVGRVRQWRVPGWTWTRLSRPLRARFPCEVARTGTPPSAAGLPRSA
jgi:hypothetical protein